MLMTTTSALAAALTFPLPPTASQGRLHPAKLPVQAGMYTWLYWAIRSGVTGAVDVPASAVLAVRFLSDGPAVKSQRTSPVNIDRATAARFKNSAT
jgi:hypothetical protein